MTPKHLREMNKNTTYFDVNFESLPKKPHPTDAQTLQELKKVMRQYNKRKVPAKLQHDADLMEPLFRKYAARKRLPYNRKKILRIMKDMQPIILKLKYHYNRKRPNVIAKKFGVKFKGDHVPSAQTPEYPSGHTIQAYVIAKILGKEHPAHKKDFLKIAEMISQSRIDRGVHFPSAIKYGKELANHIYKAYKEPKNIVKVAGARIPRKAGQPAGSDKHSDLYTDENPEKTIHGLKFATPEDARKSVSKIKSSGRTHAHKTQAAIAMEQRARVAGKTEAANAYRAFIEEQKKITKERQKTAMVSYGQPPEQPHEDDPNLPENQHHEDPKKAQDEIADMKARLSRKKKKRLLLAKDINKKELESMVKVKQRKANDVMEEDGKSDVYIRDKEKYSSVRKGNPIYRIRKNGKSKRFSEGLEVLRQKKMRDKLYNPSKRGKLF